MKITLTMAKNLRTASIPENKQTSKYLKDLAELVMDGQDMGVIQNVEFLTDPNDGRDDIQMGHSLTLKD